MSRGTHEIMCGIWTKRTESDESRREFHMEFETTQGSVESDEQVTGRGAGCCHSGTEGAWPT